jgi:glycosidase
MVIVAGLLTGPAAAGDVLLQYFEGQWETIERRMPDVFTARYHALWVPPPGKADSGEFSVGYDVYDRFHLGRPGDRTLYGTEESFRRLSQEMSRAGVLLYIDTIVNHNGFRDSSTSGFEASGGYPGFVTRLPGDADGDFHGAFEGGDWNMRLAGLIDIAQEKNHQFVRHPVPDVVGNIPNETARESNRMLYPDLDLPLAHGRRPFNLANPMAGDPYTENATGLLMRYLQWMAEVHGVDGFRIDAVKHVPQWFYNDYYDAAVYNVARNAIDGSAFTPFSFGEAFDTNFALLESYTRKDGYGNRDVLDFPLFYAMKSVFDAGGFGNIGDLEFASFDGSDGGYNDGTRGVMFVNSHDEEGGGYTTLGPGYNIVAHAHILTRTGYPVVYYNAHEFGTERDFPKPGRWEALGNTSDLITRLVRINKEYVRGAHATRWVDDTVYIYERVNACLVGLNDRGDGGFDTRTVDTGFAPGMVLVELTGNATSATVDPYDDIYDTVTVGLDGKVTIRVPRNRNPDGLFHGRGYVIYGPQKPTSTLSVTNTAWVIGADPTGGTEGVRRLTPLHVVTDDTIEVQLEVAASPVSDNALVKINFGAVDVDGDSVISAHGPFAGFESFPSINAGVHTASIDATTLPEGYNYIETVAFLERPLSTPAIYDNQRLVVYLDRLPPQAELVYPSRTGTRDIESGTYEVAVAVDHTVNNVHVLRDVSPSATDGEIIAMLGAGTQAWRRDRLEWRREVGGFAGNGTTELTVVAFEETGNYSITRFGGIGYDTSPAPVVPLVISDTAGSTLYNTGWHNGAKGGSGLGVWVLSTSGVNAGHFIGSSTGNGDGDSNADGDIDTAGRSWGLWAQTGTTASAVRLLESSVPVDGQVLVKMDNGWIATGGVVGVGLRNASGQNLTEFYFVGGESAYRVDDGTGSDPTTLGFSDEGLTLIFSQRSGGTYDLSIERLAGGSELLTGRALKSPSGGQSIAQVRLFSFAAGTGSAHDAFFNSLFVSTTGGLVPVELDLFAVE